jgi:hypothetical protein
MRPRRIVIGLLLSLGLAGQTGRAASAPAPETTATFERLKALVGEWKTDDGQESLAYELVAGGTALLERETAANRPTMLTLYHRDGDRLLLTHYCMAGNQPRMVARPFDAKTGELAFEFLDATNLAQPGAGHMHQVTFRFVDATHLETVWQFHEDGKTTMTERARYARVR